MVRHHTGVLKLSSVKNSAQPWLTQILKMDRYVEYMGLICIMLLSTALAGCPSKCNCSENAVTCSGKSLLATPNFETLNNNPVIIDLSSNRLDFISHYSLSFDKAEMVQVLYLNDSQIIDVDDNAFREVVNIREIYLSHNVLGYLYEESFKYNAYLEILDLSYNLFTKMPKLASNSLITLNLINSKVENIQIDVLDNLPNLSNLYLQRNNIKMIDVNMFTYSPRLTTIELEYNAWSCTCESVQVFNFLYTRKILKMNEAIQCKTEHNFFITIFTQSGAPETVSAACSNNTSIDYNFGGANDETEELRTQHNKKNKTVRRIKQENHIHKTSKLSNSSCDQHVENITPSTFSICLLFFASSFVAFLIGLSVGLCFRSEKISNNSSCDSLLPRDNTISYLKVLKSLDV